MRVLVTNDDGVLAPGLITVASTLHEQGHEVFVVAPLTERSGSGTALGTLDDGATIAVEKVSLPGLDIEAHGIDAPPAMGVLAAGLGQFGSPPELVVSGINPGHNTGRSVLFSSTVGGALTAFTIGIPAIAISCGFEPTHRFDTAAAIAGRAVTWLQSQQLPLVCLNINVPDLDLDQIRDIRLTELSGRSLFRLGFERSENALTLHRVPNSSKLGSGTDSGVVQNGSISVSALESIGTAAPTDAVTGLLEHLGMDLSSPVPSS